MQLLQDVQMSEPAFKPPLCVLLTDEQRVAVQELEQAAVGVWLACAKRCADPGSWLQHC